MQNNAKPIRNPYRAPNTNEYIDRFVKSIGQEFLDRFVNFGPAHMDSFYQEHLECYHQERPTPGTYQRAIGETQAGEK